MSLLAISILIVEVFFIIELLILDNKIECLKKQIEALTPGKDSEDYGHGRQEKDY